MAQVIINVLGLLYTVIMAAIFIDAMSSWIMQGRTNSFLEIVHSITAPILQPAKSLQDRLIPNLMFDFSPIIAWFVVGLIYKILLIVVSVVAK